MTKCKWILTIVITGLLIIACSTTNLQYASANDQQESKSEEKAPKLKNEDINRLTHDFMAILKQDIDANYKVIQFDTKKELLNQFEKIATKEVAQQFIDIYFTEKADGLYIIPTETPPWFIEENDYDMIKVNDLTVKVVQDNYTDMNGNYTVEFEFTYDNDWKLTAISYK